MILNRAYYFTFAIVLLGCAVELWKCGKAIGFFNKNGREVLEKQKKGEKFPSVEDDVWNVGLPSAGAKHRRTPTEVMRFLRKAIEPNMVAQERSFERILFSYANHLGGEGPLLYRYCGSSGTGKTTMACFVAGAMYHTGAPFNPETCTNASDATQLGEHVVSHTFRKAGNAIPDILKVIKEVNKKLDLYPEGIIVILNDYNLADKNVWAVMSSFVKQENLKNSIVILTDDLTSDISTEFKSSLKIHLTPATSENDALEIIVNEIKRVFPEDYHDLSGHDIWIPFLPLHPRAVETLIEKVCDSVELELTKSINGYLGRLLCDTKSKTQASLKLDTCVVEKGARVLNTFHEAFKGVLAQRKFCVDPLGDFTECLSRREIPMVSIGFEVIPSNPQSDECSMISMQEWISFRLLDG